MKLQGIFPALTSSFDRDGNLSKEKTLYNIGKLNQLALTGYVVCGSTGETPLLTTEERLQLMEWVAGAAAPGKTLIAGVGAESVRETIRMANCAAEMGYHAALTLTPFYYKVQMHRPETQTLFFQTVADHSKIPLLLYNIPQVTGYHVPVETIAKLSEHPNIAGMKDSSGNLEKMAETLPAVNGKFQVLSGGGSNFYDALKLGAAGAILAIANPIPYACILVWEAFRTREYEAAQDWQSRILPVAQLLAGKYGIPGIKYAMDLNGYFGGSPRMPFVPPSVPGKQAIEEAMKDLRS